MIAIVQPSIIKEIGQVISRLAKSGEMAILLVEQYYDFAESLADHYVVMSRGEVSFIWALTALGFVLTTGAAKIFLHEEVSPARWCGVFLIMCGAGLITWTEKMKEEAGKVAVGVEGRVGKE